MHGQPAVDRGTGVMRMGGTDKLCLSVGGVDLEEKMALPPQPIIYEINTWVWLQDLAGKYGRPITLGTVPEEEWDAVASLGVDALWLMGVWERSPRGARISRTSQGLQKEYAFVLPDLSPLDVVGSPYSVHRYEVDERLGGPDALALARERLCAREIGLILDFVPNHVAADHAWVTGHPEYFVQGNGEDLVRSPYDFFVSGGRIMACGRDPYFPSWTDTAQLNAFDPRLRKAAAETVMGIASRCDGVRCDMAMLLINGVFEKTWGKGAGTRPEQEFWEELIPLVRRHHPGFVFMAEAYWDLEWELQQQGFDYCYDKRLYDRLLHGNAETIRFHLSADLPFQHRLLRFMENHDEPRAASVFSPSKNRAAAVVIATLPGAKLFHEGQFEGRRIKVPVQLGRRPAEAPDPELAAFYRTLLQVVPFRRGEWCFCEVTGWPDNPSHENLLAWCLGSDDEKILVVANVSGRASQGRVKMPRAGLGGKPWILHDVLKGLEYEREGDDMEDPGLFVALDPYGYHVFRFDHGVRGE
jgi:glycosidase